MVEAEMRLAGVALVQPRLYARTASSSESVPMTLV
jgi:hypothetical protein